MGRPRLNKQEETQMSEVKKVVVVAPLEGPGVEVPEELMAALVEAGKVRVNSHSVVSGVQLLDMEAEAGRRGLGAARAALEALRKGPSPYYHLRTPSGARWPQAAEEAQSEAAAHIAEWFSAGGRAPGPEPEPEAQGVDADVSRWFGTQRSEMGGK